MPRILVVDDEAGIRSLLSLAFRRAGHEVKTAPDPFQAMELFSSESFDAIVSDVQMPGMDGHGLVRWVAATYPQTRSVLMSAYDIHCGDCPFAGRCKLLRKPFLPNHAVAAVEQALNRPAELPIV